MLKQKIIATVVVSFGVGCIFSACDYWSFIAGFAGGFGVSLVFDLWLDED